METITFNYKTKLEQFKEQLPELYQELYNEIESTIYKNIYGDPNDDVNFMDDSMDNNPACYEPEEQQPADDSERFYDEGKNMYIYRVASELESKGYKSGNTDWRNFLSHYNDWEKLYIVWNDTHKVFAIESDMGTINQIYIHLCQPEFKIFDL